MNQSKKWKGKSFFCKGVRAEKDLLDRKILGADIVKSLKITKAAVNSDKNLVEEKNYEDEDNDDKDNDKRIMMVGTVPMRMTRTVTMRKMLTMNGFSRE